MRMAFTRATGTAACLAATAALFGCHAGNDPKGMPMTMPMQPDWEALSFTCIREDDRLPRTDQEAEEWYQESRAFYKDGIKRDSEPMLRRSFELAMKAAQRNHVKAMNNVVVSYRDGEGVEQSDDKAVQWAEKLMAMNMGRGYYHMGTFLEQGIGVKPDKAKALAYFRKAADLGNAQGQVSAGRAIIRAFMQHPDSDRGYSIGEAMLQCALDQRSAEAGYELGRHFEGSRKEIGKALRAYQAAGRLGHSQSLYLLEVIFREGTLGTTIDTRRADIYERLWREADAEKGKTFPNLDTICPLPPAKLPGS
jgi:TPR repeat protein